MSNSYSCRLSRGRENWPGRESEREREGEREGKRERGRERERERGREREGGEERGRERVSQAMPVIPADVSGSWYKMCACVCVPVW